MDEPEERITWEIHLSYGNASLCGRKIFDGSKKYTDVDCVECLHKLVQLLLDRRDTEFSCLQSRVEDILRTLDDKKAADLSK